MHTFSTFASLPDLRRCVFCSWAVCRVNAWKILVQYKSKQLGGGGAGVLHLDRACPPHTSVRYCACTYTVVPRPVVPSQAELEARKVTPSWSWKRVLSYVYGTPADLHDAGSDGDYDLGDGANEEEEEAAEMPRCGCVVA